MKSKFAKKDAIILIVIIILITSIILTKPLSDLDELWNYNFARNIAEERLPYKDFNMIQMPLLPIICGLVLKAFSNELIVMRIIAIFLNSLILFLVYKILKQLKVNDYLIYLSLIAIYFVYYNYFCLDYNFMIVFIALLAIYWELKWLESDKELLKNSIKHDFLLGILVGISILLKQTTGIFLTLIFIFYKILIASKKEDWKEIIKIIAMRFIGATIPVVVLFVYLISNNIWNDFLDYAIYGIKTFDNKISYMHLLKHGELAVKMLGIIIPTTIIYMYIKTIVKAQKSMETRNLFILFSYSVACFIVAFPISDSIHFLIGSMPAIISLVYISWILIHKRKCKIILFAKWYAKIFSFLTTLTLIMLSTTLIILYFADHADYSIMNHFKFIPSTLDNSIIQINNYIEQQNFENKKVYILDATACMYMIPINKYNKNYDMFLKGNLGSKGEVGQIENLDKEENVIVLIKNENYSRNWQNPEQVRKHIIENWAKKGEINEFDIYEKE